MILPIARMGHPILQKRAEEVTDIGSTPIQELISNLIETCYSLNGAGLAAPQVFHSQRIVMFHIPEERAKMRGHHAEIPLTILINPEIEILTDETILGWEGCFSLPGMMGEVPRYQAVRYRAFNEKGQRIEQVVEGYHARVVQHECDHLDGILYPMRMRDMSRYGFAEEIKEAIMNQKLYS